MLTSTADRPNEPAAAFDPPLGMSGYLTKADRDADIAFMARFARPDYEVLRRALVKHMAASLDSNVDLGDERSVWAHLKDAGYTSGTIYHNIDSVISRARRQRLVAFVTVPPLMVAAFFAVNIVGTDRAMAATANAAALGTGARFAVGLVTILLATMAVAALMRDRRPTQPTQESNDIVSRLRRSGFEGGDYEIG